MTDVHRLTCTTSIDVASYRNMEGRDSFFCLSKGMNNLLHITSGDCAGDLLRQTGIPGEILVWHDILYDGPRCPGWPGEETLVARAPFICLDTFPGIVPYNGLGQLQPVQLASAYDQRRAVTDEIEGPAPKLPQWELSLDLEQFTVTRMMHPGNQRSTAEK